MVAPWLDPEREKTIDFFDFKIDKDLLKRVEDIHLFISTDDDKDILESESIIQENISNIKINEFSNL